MKKIFTFFAAALLFGMTQMLNAQCTNGSSYASATISGGAVTTISTCSYAGEYSTISGAVAGTTLQFTMSNLGTGAYITIHAGSPAGAVLASGSSPLTYANGFTGTLYAHWNLGAGCGTDFSCHTTTVQCTSCGAPPPSVNCTNGTSYGAATIPANNNVTTISTCSYAGEYSTVSGAVAGQTLTFASSAGDYITVHAGSPAGAIIAQGLSPLTFSNGFTGTIYPHWNLATGCGAQNTCRTTTVQCQNCVAAPCNDFTFTAPFSHSSTTVGAGNDCNLAASEDRTYKITINTAGCYTFSLCGGPVNWDSYIYLTSACCGGTLLASNDDGCGGIGLSVISNVNLAAGIYYLTIEGYAGVYSGAYTLNVTGGAGPAAPGAITGPAFGVGCSSTNNAFSVPFVAGITFNWSVSGGGSVASGQGTSSVLINWGAGAGTVSVTASNACGTSGATTLTLNCQPPPPNDNCTGAIPVACGQTVNGSTLFSNADAGAPVCAAVVGTGGVWYKMLGNGSCVTASLCGGANFDTQIHVYTSTGACAGPFACVTGNDDFCGLQSQVQFNTNPGTLYYIRVNNYSGAGGTFSLGITCTFPQVNDVACGATPIGMGATPYTVTTCDGVEAGEPVPAATGCNEQDGWCESSLTHTVWFSFEAPASGCVSIAAGGFDSQIALYEVGDCGDFATYSQIAANDDDGDVVVPGEHVFSAGIIQASCLVAGQTYYVQVDGYFGATGSGDIYLEDCGNAPLAVDAGDCQSLYTGYTGACAPATDAVICPSGSGGFPPYTYSISPGTGVNYNCTNGCFNVSPSGTTTYTITVTDSRGCTATDEVTVQVLDVLCQTGGNNAPGNPSHKVIVCHVPPGNPPNQHEICIDQSGVPAHICGGSPGHAGCYLGPCSNSCRSTNAPCVQQTCGGNFDVTFTPNFYCDEMVVTVSNAGGTLASWGPCPSFGTSGTVTLSVSSGTEITVNFSTVGTFNDNAGTYSIACGGNTIESGAFPGGAVTTIADICCVGGANKTATPATLASGSANGIIAFPNPFSDATTFKFRSGVDGNATVVVYNVAGEQVGVVFNGAIEAGHAYEANFSASGLSSGMYTYRYTAADGSVSAGKINIIR